MIARPAALAKIVGDPAAEPADLDFRDCDREPIHVPGRIQPYGFLLALNFDWAVTHASANIGDYTGLGPEAWWGRSIDAMIDPVAAHIRGLISQTRGSAETADGFISTLDERVQSLARAHDQITSERWGPARLKDLIDTEAGAYLGANRDRVAVTGVNVLVAPGAFTTLALVFHELMTNAAKYGALSSDGSVLIAWQLDEVVDLLIDWSEQGGPPVVPPTRRGFGSTIIERSIPYDLGGIAEVTFRPGGLGARFRIPAEHLAGLSDVDMLLPALLPPTDVRLLAGLAVLLVEDSMIIAMDCAETLKSMGAVHVTTASSSAEALAALENRDFQFALLDFNLGSETSGAVADVLAERGIRFAFATGYGGRLPNMDHASAPVISKPCDKKQLLPVLVKLGFEPQV